MNGFEIILTVFISISLVLNLIFAFYWYKADREVYEIKVRFIKDLFWIRNGQANRGQNKVWRDW